MVVELRQEMLPCVKATAVNGRTNLQVVVIMALEKVKHFDIITHLRVTCVDENI